MDIDFTDIDGICFDDVCGEVSQYKKAPHFTIQKGSTLRTSNTNIQLFGGYDQTCAC